jgi:hypothetical protein
LKLNICGWNGAQQLLCSLQRYENQHRIQAANWFGNSMFIEANTAATLNTETCTHTLRNESTGSNASLMSQLQYLAHLTNTEWRLAVGKKRTESERQWTDVRIALPPARNKDAKTATETWTGTCSFP